MDGASAPDFRIVTLDLQRSDFHESIRPRPPCKSEIFSRKSNLSKPASFTNRPSGSTFPRLRRDPTLKSVQQLELAVADRIGPSKFELLFAAEIRATRECLPIL